MTTVASSFDDDSRGIDPRPVVRSTSLKVSLLIRIIYQHRTQRFADFVRVFGTHYLSDEQPPFRVLLCMVLEQKIILRDCNRLEVLHNASWLAVLAAESQP